DELTAIPLVHAPEGCFRRRRWFTRRGWGGAHLRKCPCCQQSDYSEHGHCEGKLLHNPPPCSWGAVSTPLLHVTSIGQGHQLRLPPCKWSNRHANTFLPAVDKVERHLLSPLGMHNSGT